MDNLERVMTVEQVAEWLQVSGDTIYTMCRDGELPHFRLRRSLRFREKDIKLWIEQNVVESGKEVSIRNDSTKKKRKLGGGPLLHGRSGETTSIEKYDWESDGDNEEGSRKETQQSQEGME